MFLHDASENPAHTRVDEKNFLDSQYIMIRRRFVDIEFSDERSQNSLAPPSNDYKDNYSTELLIYSMKDLAQPLVSITDRKFERLQLGFFIKSQTSPNIIFSLMGDYITYVIECKPNRPMKAFNRVGIVKTANINHMLEQSQNP